MTGWDRKIELSVTDRLIACVKTSENKLSVLHSNLWNEMSPEMAAYLMRAIAKDLEEAASHVGRTDNP